MNNEEARWMLQLYRHNGSDAADPRFHEALEQVRRDPELAQWFANECAVDSRISEKLRESFDPPSSLKSALLAQRRFVHENDPAGRTRWILGMAAAVLVALGIGIGMLQVKQISDPKLAVYRADMTDFAKTKLNRLDLVTKDVGEIRQWLNDEGGYGEFVLPSGLEGRPGVGCRLLDWQGSRVSLICFELANGRVVHLFVVNQDAVGAFSFSTPEFHEAQGVVTAAWSGQGLTYILMCKTGTLDDLKSVI